MDTDFLKEQTACTMQSTGQGIYPAAAGGPVCPVRPGRGRNNPRKPRILRRDLEGAQWDALKRAPETASNRAVLDVFERFGDVLAHCASRLSRFAGYCREDTGHFYLTHGDAGGNFFVADGRNFILDWDEVMYAPLSGMHG